MGDPAEKTDDAARYVVVDADRFDRLVRALERLVQAEERKLTQEQNVRRRAQGALSALEQQAQERVAARMRKWAGESGK